MLQFHSYHPGSVAPGRSDGGGRTKAIPHIAPTEENAVKQLESDIKKAMMIISIKKLQRRKISTDSRLREQSFSNVIWKVAEIFSVTKSEVVELTYLFF